MSYEPPLEERLRKSDAAVGLRNVGNTCYFNSLLQIYYSLPNFVERIFKREDKELQGKDELMTKRIQSGRKMVEELKKVFALMATGNKSYVEPSAILKAIVDDSGHQVQIGDEKDIAQFNEIFLSRISDYIKASTSPVLQS